MLGTRGLTSAPTRGTLLTGPTRPHRKEIEMKNLGNFASNTFISSCENKQRQKPQHEVGKEPVKINLANEQKQYCQQEPQKQTTAICSVTGIAIEILALPLPLQFEYRNPLASFKNAKAVSMLPIQELMNTDIRILAGCILSILHTCSLLENNKNPEQSNIDICTYGQKKAIQILKSAETIAISTIGNTAMQERLPHFDLAESENLGQFILDCLAIIKPIMPAVEKPAKLQTVSTVQTKTKTDSNQLNLRTLLQIRKLAESCTISHNARKIIVQITYAPKTLTQGNKNKILDYLLGCEDENCAELAALFSKIPAQITMLEQFNDEPSSVEPAGKKQTALEMLIEFRAKRSQK